ncbi:DUF924 family protein [Nostoc edaphicum CCNP1411]|uniref:DUF924 family protein n=1 Tax=Nostoc edaphicum CCNP1411 TaxID=1472755 RepID=A0A7D7QI42_9NOSO|nr:DUF924 family protein [Nostoc edaphicum CCNP1411]
MNRLDLNIESFGGFQHRKSILDRTSSSQEEEFFAAAKFIFLE